MAGFEFEDTAITLEICGEMYQIDPHGETVLGATETYLGAMRGTGVTQEDDLRAAVEEARRSAGTFLDTLFGSEGRERIMQGRELDLMAYQQVVSYIMASIMAHRAKATANLIRTATQAVKTVVGASPQA